MQVVIQPKILRTNVDELNLHVSYEYILFELLWDQMLVIPTITISVRYARHPPVSRIKDLYFSIF